MSLVSCTTNNIDNELIRELILQSDAKCSTLDDYTGIYLLHISPGLMARCWTYNGDKIIVQLAGSEWVIDNMDDVARTATDLNTFKHNTKQ